MWRGEEEGGEGHGGGKVKGLRGEGSNAEVTVEVCLYVWLYGCMANGCMAVTVVTQLSGFSGWLPLQPGAMDAGRRE